MTSRSTNCESLGQPSGWPSSCQKPSLQSIEHCSWHLLHDSCTSKEQQQRDFKTMGIPVDCCGPSAVELRHRRLLGPVRTILREFEFIPWRAGIMTTGQDEDNARSLSQKKDPMLPKTLMIRHELRVLSQRHVRKQRGQKFQ